MGTSVEKETKYSIKIGLDIHNVLGKKQNSEGYFLLKIPTHPKAYKNGYILEHRVVFESVIGFYLDSDVIVHHKNKNKKDNRFANLQLMDRGEHTKLHHKGAKRNEEIRRKNSLATIKLGWVGGNHPNYKNVDEDVKSLYLQGVPVLKIAELTGVNRRTIYNRIEKLGLKEKKHDK